MILEFYLGEQRDVVELLVELASSIAANLDGLVARKLIEDELDREQELLTDMMDAAPIGSTVLSDDGRAKRMNDRAFVLRQLPSDAPSLDAGVREFSDESGEPVPAAERPCARVYETDRAVYDWIAQVERPDGNQK